MKDPCIKSQNLLSIPFETVEAILLIGEVFLVSTSKNVCGLRFFQYSSGM